MRKLQRRSLILFGGAAVPIALASAAFACQSTVTLYASPSTVAPGGTVKVTGNKYNSSSTFGPVDIRLDSRTAKPLASTTPVGGNIEVDVKIPQNTSTGYHILIATQYNESGTPCTGCPGRTTIKVVSPTAAASGVGGVSSVTNPLGLAASGVAALTLTAAWRSRRRTTAAS
ncbi:MAG: hypothetical protein M3Q48_04340 [Actinomycetota bacterium]|nr:hypothetical protein [Actinomycetota bacterium]